MNRFLLPLWLNGAVLYVSNGASSERPQCSSQGEEVILTISAAPHDTEPGFETIELLVPKNLKATGSIE